MIVTQRITSITAEPDEYTDFETVNVLKWTGKYKALCPYYLRTDGLEEHVNPGNVLFENYWQGSKVYPVVYSNKVYPSKYQQGNDRYLMWEYTPTNPEGDRVLTDTGDILYPIYTEWRDSLWKCNKPIRYPNGYHARHTVKFGLFQHSDGTEERLDYLSMRKRVYLYEYNRLIGATPEYQELLTKLRAGTNLMICEIDVPSKGKKGEYGKCQNGNTRKMTLSRLDKLLNDPSEAFGHGLCLALKLLQEK